MVENNSSKNVAFVVPTLSEHAAQDEDIVQLLLFAAAKLEQVIKERPGKQWSATIISIDRNASGWTRLSKLFSEAALQHTSVALLEEPAVPNLSAPASHKSAYNLYEYLKGHNFDEIHLLDRYGLAYYPTQAKQLGLAFHQTSFAIHVVGGVLFRREAADQLLDDLGPLVD
ncbi:MAG TPA: hypothetical protein VFX76_06365, partial [Roseiflexaceae bacterium]|nr:hypothetical protein [Roseiflexaceae bacterium]